MKVTLLNKHHILLTCFRQVNDKTSVSLVSKPPPGGLLTVQEQSVLQNSLVLYSDHSIVELLSITYPKTTTFSQFILL